MGLLCWAPLGEENHCYVCKEACRAHAAPADIESTSCPMQDDKYGSDLCKLQDQLWEHAAKSASNRQSVGVSAGVMSPPGFLGP